jgi:hypothetical protein
MPDPVVTDPQSVQVASQPEATPQAPPSTPPPASPDPTPPTPPTSPAAPSLLETLRSQGIDIDAQDEQGALQAIAQRWREHQQLTALAPAARQYLQNRDQFTQWQRAQQAEEAKKKADQPKPWYSEWFTPPEYNPAWERMITTDANGNLVAVPGAPPGVVEKYQAYRQSRSELADKFMSNPYEFMEPAVKHLAQQIAQQEVQKHLQQYRDQNFAKEFVTQQASWLYDRTQDGNLRYQQIVDPGTGRVVQQPVLSTWGAKLRDYVMEESQRQGQRGYSDLDEQQRNALTRVQLEYAMSRLQELEKGQPAASAAPAAPPPSPREAANGRFLAGGRPGSPATPPSVTPPSQPPKDLAERLRERFKAQGVTDEALARDIR